MLRSNEPRCKCDALDLGVEADLDAAAELEAVEDDCCCPRLDAMLCPARLPLDDDEGPATACVVAVDVEVEAAVEEEDAAAIAAAESLVGPPR